MKYILIILFLFSTTGLASKSLMFGESVDQKSKIEISHLLSNAKDFLNKEVVISGKIVDVCSHRGCWLKLASDKKFQSIRIKVKDGEMVFPLTSRGKNALVKGILIGQEYSKDEAIRYLSYLATESQEKFDPTTVTGPMMIYQVKAKGVLIE